MNLTEKEIIEEIVQRRNRARDNKVGRGQEMNKFGYNPTIMSAYDFYRGIEYELTKLLDWLGYEE